jgi:UDP-N-acetylmuramoyl-tripeptide--D-alanyl-D-alanine ligase
MRTVVKKVISNILKAESKLVLQKYKPKIVAITGSVGKTSTKDAVYAVLSQVSYVRKSEKSFNSEIGLPLTILGLPNAWNNWFGWIANFLKGLWLILTPHQYPKWLVLEVGIGKPGDMKKTALWLKTDAVIITAIGKTPPHIEFFDSRKDLIEEKSQLIKTLKPDGLLVLNGDDPDVYDMRGKFKYRTITYGFGENANLKGSTENIFYNDAGLPSGIIYRVDEGDRSIPVVIEGVFGRNHIYASLAALTLSSGLQLNIVEAANALKVYDLPPGRMRLLPGINNSIIIDDTYNSSPYAAEAALRTLGSLNRGEGIRKIAILGDMLELGKYTIEAHRDIGQVAGEILTGSEDVLIVVGLRAKTIKEGANEAGLKKKNIYEFHNSYEAADFIKDFVRESDQILVKGSQGMRMERVVEKILLDQDNKKKFLVRQDDEWLKRK